MTVNQKIENALADLVDGNIWPLAAPKEASAEQWIVYLSELDAPEEFGDDEDLEWVHYMQVHWFSRSGRPTSYWDMRSKIRTRLKEAGFSVSQFAYDYEKDTRTSHMVCHCSIMED